ncbi:MAG TPA: acyltransferase domain-containing protein, partial [Pirellulales bacterium]
MNGELDVESELAGRSGASVMSGPASADEASTVVADRPAWNAESFVIAARDREDLQARVHVLLDFVRATPDVRLADLAAALARQAMQAAPGDVRLGIVAGTLDDLTMRLARAAERLADPKVVQIRDVTGIYYTERPLFLEGSVALLFPGEGTPYVGMVGDLAPHFPEVADVLDYCDAVQAQTDPDAPSASRFLRVPADAPPEVKAAAEEGLKNFDDSVASTMTASYALLSLLVRLGVPYTATAGHSAGEICALGAAGAVISEGPVAVAMGRSMRESSEQALAGADATLLAAAASRETLAAAVIEATGAPPVSRDEIVAGTPIAADRVYLAMDNCPHQTVVVGVGEGVARVEKELLARRVMCERLPLHLPYHTPLFEPHLGPLTMVFGHMKFQAPELDVYSCSTAEPFPPDPEAIKRQTIHQWAEPVEFTRLIRRMHADGVRIFLECGPRATCTGFVDDILRGQSYLAMPTSVPRKSGLMQLGHVVAQLSAHHTPLNLTSLYEGRAIQPVAWSDAARELFASEDSDAGVDRQSLAADSGLTDETAMLAPVNIEPSAPRHRLASAPVAPLARPESGVVRDEVMHEYLVAMQKFLAAQQTVMQAYLAGPAIADHETHAAHFEVGSQQYAEAEAPAEEAAEQGELVPESPLEEI